MVDAFSKYLLVYLLPNKTAQAVADILTYQHYPAWGVPHELYMDLGSEFTVSITNAMSVSTGVDHQFVLRNTHHSNMVERYQRTIMEIYGILQQEGEIFP